MLCCRVASATGSSLADARDRRSLDLRSRLQASWARSDCSRAWSNSRAVDHRDLYPNGNGRPRATVSHWWRRGGIDLCASLGPDRTQAIDLVTTTIPTTFHPREDHPSGLVYSDTVRATLTRWTRRPSPPPILRPRQPGVRRRREGHRRTNRGQLHRMPRARADATGDDPPGTHHTLLECALRRRITERDRAATR